MIERIARRAGGFAATTALRWLDGARDSVAEVELAPRKNRSGFERLRKPLKGGAVASTLVLLSSNRLVRGEVAKGLRWVTEALRPDHPSSPSRSPQPSTRSTSAHSNGAATNGKGGSLSQKTRDELYELAKKKDIAGRSNMSKDELLKALKEA